MAKGHYARNLRIKLWREHLGLPQNLANNTYDDLIEDPLSVASYELWTN